MKQLVVVVAIVVLAALGGVVYWMTGRSSAAIGSGSGSGSVAVVTPEVSRPPTKVTKIDKARRQELAEQIKRAQEARAAAGSGSSAGSATVGSSPTKRVVTKDLSQAELDALRTPLLDALKDIEPMIKDCWKQAMPERPDVEIKAAMFLSGDPDIGTLVDSQDVTDHDGKPLPQKLQDCVYDVFTGIELPPLREGDKVKFTSVITFTHDEDGKD